MNTKQIITTFIVLMITVMCATAFVAVPTITDGVGFQYENILIGDDRIQIGDTNITKETTFVVAASDSLHKEGADFICDGVADQVQIQAAIDALPNNGGRVVLMEGFFHINDTIHLYRDIPDWFNLFLEGQGLQATRIKLAANSDCDMIDINALDNNSGWKGVANMQLSGNEANQASGHGIHAFVSGTGGLFDMRFKNVFCYDMKQNGFHLDEVWGTYLDNCLGEYCGGSGLYLKGDESYVYGFHSSVNGGHGISLQGSGLHLSHCRVSQVDTGIYLNRLSKSVIANNEVNQFGIAGGHKRGIYLGGTSFQNNIHNNIITGGGGNSDYGFTLNTDTTVGKNNIHDNTFSGADVADLQVQWTGISVSRIANNFIDVMCHPSMGVSNIVVGNPGINPVGVFAQPFDNTNHNILPYRTTNDASPTVASQNYTVRWTPARIISTGGAGVAIVIKDAAGTTICSPGATCDEELEIGWSINFGGFSVAPTTTVVFK